MDYLCKFLVVMANINGQALDDILPYPAETFNMRLVLLMLPATDRWYCRHMCPLGPNANILSSAAKYVVLHDGVGFRANCSNLHGFQSSSIGLR